MRDELKEKAERGVIDNMLHTAQSALAVGAGAVFLYRNGGKKFLAEASGISSRVLGDVRKDLENIGVHDGRIHTSDVKSVIDRTFKGDNSHLSKAKKSKELGGNYLRTSDQKSNFGKMYSVYTKGSKKALNRETQKLYEYRNGIQPLANEYVSLGKTDIEKRQIREFIEKSYLSDDIGDVLASRQQLKLEQTVSNDEVDKILAAIKAKKQDIDSQKQQFGRQAERAYEPIQEKGFGIEALMEMKRKQKDESMMGDRSLTFGELIQNKERFKGQQLSVDVDDRDLPITEEATEFAERLRKHVGKVNKDRSEEAMELFDELHATDLVRVDKKGEIFNFSETKDVMDKFLDGFASTMPGKILKVRDFRESSKQPAFHIFNPSMFKADPIAAKLINQGENKDLLTLEEQVFRVYDTSYSVNNKGNLRHIKELDNTRLFSKYGAGRGLLMSISGNDPYKPKTGKAVFDYFDVARDGQVHVGDRIKSMFSKLSNPTWSGNVLDGLTTKPEQSIIDIQAMRSGLKKGSYAEKDLYSDINKYTQQSEVLNSTYSKNSYRPTATDAIKLAKGMSGKSKSYMDLVSMDDVDMIDGLYKLKGPKLSSNSEYENQDLASLLFRLGNDPRKAKNMISLKNDQFGLLGANQSDSFADLLRIELTKESMLSHASENTSFATRQLIESSGLGKQGEINANRLLDWSTLQSSTGLFANKSKERTTDELLEQSEKIHNLFLKGKNEEDEFLTGMHKNLQMLRKERVNDFESHYGDTLQNSDIVSGLPQGEFIHIKKMVSPMDLIKNLNDKETRRAFTKQWFAGRKNMEDVTTATLMPYFFVSRLSDALAPVALSFSTENKGSFGSLISAMALKRGLPIVAGMSAYDYTSDMFGTVTGENLTTTIMSGVANIDLGIRSITDATGITDKLKQEKELNPFYRYWSGDEYLNREEREDWYQNGYEEMRKGRWWNFGGIQEYRGGQVQYYQPNFLRRATSNYKDVSLYDNVWEKWSRSWMPTPTNPLSPLMYLANPYWLEEKHADERPYPMTGKMFTEETPWGPILNSTVGELVKPQKRMHTDRLDENWVDSKVLIEAENQKILEQARNKEGGHLARFKDGAIEPVTYTAYDSPTPGTRIATISSGGPQGQNVQIGNRYGAYEGVKDASAITAVSESDGAAAVLLGGEGTAATGGFEAIEDLGLQDKVEISAASGNIFSGLLSSTMGATALGNIESYNEGIKRRALANQNMSALGMPEGEGIVTTESIHRAGASFGSEVLQSGKAMSELKGLSSGDDFLGEMAYTLRFAAGIYGYGAFRAFPGGPSEKLADASDINSPVRGFWDANLGGLGGGYLEIFRRFIPAFNHKQNDFNPLLNMMPDWMPEKYRLGDPYTALPKGEMRMPGRGYESLNDLNPDQYGTYGAFDRFKILADIAPTSNEYKVWRNIAEKTIADPLLKDEIEDIKVRVEKQNKKYEFFDYRFLGRSTERANVIIDEVIDNNFFTVLGSEKVYRMAGIEVAPKTKSNFILGETMTPGAEVTLITDKDEYSGVNEDHYQSTSATVFMNGENLNRMLVDEEIAERRGDTSSAATMGVFSDFAILRGKALEALTHLQVPYYSQKFFKIRDPLESWKNEFTYGTSYASWTNPIETFLEPAFERALMSDTEVAVGAGAGLLNNYMQKNPDKFSPIARAAGTGAFALSSRGAFVGAFLGIATEGGLNGNVRKAMNVGAIAQVGMWAFTRRDEVVEGTIGAAAIGSLIGNKFSNVGRMMGGVYGAAAGLAITSMNSSVLSDGVDNEYIPERTKEKWELQEYFDRMNYVKYSGLYEKAARKTKAIEGVDIREIVTAYETSQEKNFELRQKLEEAKAIVQRAYNATDERGANLLNDIDSKLKSLETQEFSVSVGSYGKSALAYKQAMDSTIYGLSQNASWAEMVRAIPQNEREHFLEFFKEKNPDKQKEILKYISPYTAKALRIAWKQEPEELQSNESYFKDKNLPGPFWSGWRPDVDLKDVQVKTIQNEGMLLADFGYYESQLRDPSVISAPNINPDSSDMPLSTMARITGTLRGMGLTGVNVNISPSSKNGVEVIADIISTAASSPRVIENKIHQILSF